MSGRYLTDRELEEALYEDDDDLCRDYIDPDLESSDEESEVDLGEQDQDRFFEETENESSSQNSQLEQHETMDEDSAEESSDTEGNNDDTIARRRPRPKGIIDQTSSDMVSVSGLTWKPKPITRRMQIAANLMREAPGLKNGINPKLPIESFRLFFDDDIIDFILQYTNEKLALVKESTPQSAFIQKSRSFEKDEILGYMGFLITAGAYKQNKDPLIDLFSEENLPIYRATFSHSRVQLLQKCMRFDDQATRGIRKEYDNFAAARDIWERVTSKFPDFLAPSESVVIDEELITFHGRCKFRLYIPTKPGKYGIEANVLCDSKNYYCFAAEPYAGKVINQPKDYNSGPAVVKRLVVLAKLHNSGRNITMDRKFTSLPTANALLDQNLTVVGTIIQVKPETSQRRVANVKEQEEIKTEILQEEEEDVNEDPWKIKIQETRGKINLPRKGRKKIIKMDKKAK
ncbi:piggyBac transposable element-derived protein 4-like [Sitophilus oryzae]|uniref:PiggyBac transposable element-derived protein 4-like n=1 Tax=Sitophilus oryzae TaxID=7048 RepID=A0A6J2YNN9_SITOR|nr:piggyBac transposable element-derived protein 4-like [Sitophilus oryzae]